MWVRAIRRGYYGHVRRYAADEGVPGAGEPFELVPVNATDKDGNAVVISPDKQFSERWMEKVDAPEPTPAPVRKVLTSQRPPTAQPAKKSKSTGDSDVI